MDTINQDNLCSTTANKGASSKAVYDKTFKTMPGHELGENPQNPLHPIGRVVANAFRGCCRKLLIASAFP